MKYVSLKRGSLTVFKASGELSQMGGSSKYHVFNNEIVLKEKHENQKIEKTTAKEDYLNNLISDNLTVELFERICANLYELIYCNYQNNIKDYSETDKVNELYNLVTSMETDFGRAIVNTELLKERELKRQRYGCDIPRNKKKYNVLNKTKVSGKISALFNLKESSKFIAFYSVSFPVNITDDLAFICWNLFLSHLRKYFKLTNYLWITERQKNGTLHYHLLTNQFLPITQINKLMANILDRKAKEGLLDWGNGSKEKYNGIDVDSVYNSKRHKKSGKSFNKAQLRQWISKYLTKYVTKNNEKFKHLAWHCSRSISILFTSEVFLFKDRIKYTRQLPRNNELYKIYESDFYSVCVFLFIPHQKIFEKIKNYNDIIFGEFVPTSFICYSTNINPDNT